MCIRDSLIPQHVNNSTDAHEIAEKFCMHFAASSFDSYSADSGFTEISSKLEDVQPPYNDFSVSDIEQAWHQLKHGKAPGLDGIVKEHITLSHPAIIMHLTFLFNMMSAHCYVPGSFGIGIIIPLLKNKLGDTTDINNYRGITSSPLISKFEHCLLFKYKSYMCVNECSLGFKNYCVCNIANIAIFVLQQCTENFYNMVVICTWLLWMLPKHLIELTILNFFIECIILVYLGLYMLLNLS